MQNPHNTSNRWCAFTLLELLAIILVVVILLVLLTPVFDRVLDDSRQALSLKNIQTVNGGLLAWIADENRGRFPYAYIDRNQSKYPAGYDMNSLTKNYTYWAGPVFSGGYVNRIDAFFSPFQKKYWRTPEYTTALRNNPAGWQWAMIGYGASGIVMPYSGDVSGRPTMTISQLDKPSGTILLAEAAPNNSQSSGGKYDGFHAVRPKKMTYPLAVRRPGKVAVAFVDGHCEMLTPEALGWDEEEKEWVSSLDDREWPWSVPK